MTDGNQQRVSIIIPTQGHGGMTDHCVNSLLETLDQRSNVEIIVVDDASPEPIVLPSEADPRVTVIRSETNLGFAGACNLGAAQSQAPFVVFLNNDTTPQAGWLDSMMACAESDTAIAIVGARLLYRDGTVQHAGIAFSQRDGEPRHIYRGFPGEHPAVLRDRDFQAVTGACFLVRREAFNNLGGFDTAFTNGHEDIDFCLRARGQGLRTRYCGTAVVVHLESVSRRTDDEEPDSNRSVFDARWGCNIVRDELQVYADDGLLRMDSDDVYPLQISCAVELAIGTKVTSDVELARLLSIRSRQVFDLEKEIGCLTARLQDHGIEP